MAKTIGYWENHSDRTHDLYSEGPFVATMIGPFTYRVEMKPHDGHHCPVFPDAGVISECETRGWKMLGQKDDIFSTVDRLNTMVSDGILWRDRKLCWRSDKSFPDGQGESGLR